MNKVINILFLALLPVAASAQSDDFGIWTSVGAEKKIDRKWSVEAEAEFRTRNDSKTADRWSGGIGVDYKLMKGLKMSAGYTLLYDNNIEKITYHSDGDYNNWRPSYWGIRHRFNVSLTGDVDWGNFNFSLRECWQYTYRPEKTTDRYDFDNSQWETTTVGGKGKSVLRSRFQVEYNIPHCKINPYANVELYNGWALQKTRYTVGADWKLTKHHSVGLYYRYQNVNSDDDNEPGMHIVGVNYNFKF
jgi:predicted porin